MSTTPTAVGPVVLSRMPDGAPGTWYCVDVPDRRTVFICCPVCAHTFYIVRFTIAPDGLVIPAVTCPQCAAVHVFRLDDFPTDGKRVAS